MVVNKDLHHHLFTEVVPVTGPHLMAAVVETEIVVAEVAAAAAAEEAPAAATVEAQETEEEDISLPFFCFIAAVFYRYKFSVCAKRCYLFISSG